MTYTNFSQEKMFKVKNFDLEHRFIHANRTLGGSIRTDGFVGSNRTKTVLFSFLCNRGIFLKIKLVHLKFIHKHLFSDCTQYIKADHFQQWFYHLYSMALCGPLDNRPNYIFFHIFCRRPYPF